jgi:hypothetical protein
MKIGIIGTGDVGRTLASGFIKYGHEVMLGSRDVSQEKVQQWLSVNSGNASLGNFSEAAAFGEVVVIATPWSGTKNAINLANASNFTGKTVIDVTNPLDFSNGFPPKLAGGLTGSAGEMIQHWLLGANVVKAFNIVGNTHMVNPKFSEGTPDMFICGNDTKAKVTVNGFLNDFGWQTIDLGNIAMSKLLESLAMIWIVYGFSNNSWNHAFKLLRK